jgi:hypothetical protein
MMYDVQLQLLAKGEKSYSGTRVLWVERVNCMLAS